MNKWDTRGIDLAKLISTWSKDPSTKVGAAIFRPDNTLLSVGFNGLPRGVKDDVILLENKEFKYETILHAESNAIDFASERPVECTIYIAPMFPCAQCASRIIQSGIKRVVYSKTIKTSLKWEESFLKAKLLFKMAGVKCEEYIAPIIAEPVINKYLVRWE